MRIIHGDRACRVLGYHFDTSFVCRLCRSMLPCMLTINLSNKSYFKTNVAAMKNTVNSFVVALDELYNAATSIEI